MLRIPEIQGSKFKLREFRFEKDKESIWENVNYPEIVNTLTLEYPYTEEYWQGFIKINSEDNGDYHWMIDVNNKVIGVVSLMSKDKNCHKHIGKFGYWLGKNYWNQGMMSEAVGLVVKYAFEELNLMKLKIDCLYDNIGSRKIAEKNGFEFEYVAHKEALMKGEYKDLVYYSKYNSK